jgi:hypothetical protein
MDSAVFLISPGGLVRGLYTDEVDWPALGRVRVTRASTVEFDETMQGWVVTILETAERLGPFRRRAEAIEAEVAILTGHLSSDTYAETPRAT